MLKKILRKWLGIDSQIPATPKPEAMKISSMTLARTAKPEVYNPVVPVTPPKGVVPEGSPVLAMDDAADYAYINSSGGSTYWQGYPALSMLTQLPEYRKLSSEVAKAMVRKWIKLSTKGEDDQNDKSDKIAQLQDAMTRFEVRERFREAAEHDGLFGRGQIFIDIDMPKGGSAKDDPIELETPLIMHEAKIKKGALKALRIVEPVWTYPSAYNARDPLQPDFYKPSKWYIMGKTVHTSRLLMFISRPMPDLLKSAYSFGGLSMSQLAMPYIQNWIRTRDSISDLVHSFSTSGIKTDMASVLSDGDDATFLNRAELFNKMRDNRGLMILDKDMEEFFQFNAPLGGLDSLQQQAQEQMASVANMPLIVLLGITPSGLNASSEGELRVWNDYIHSQQEAIFRDNLQTVLNVLQLNEFGEIDEDITFDFEALEEMTDEQKATIEKTKADTDNVLIQAGVIAPEEARQRLADDQAGSYNSIDVDDLPETPEPEGEPEDDPSGGKQPPAQDSIAEDMTWRENDHKRAANGQFGEGGGGAAKPNLVQQGAQEKAKADKRKFGYVDLKGRNRSGKLSRREHEIESEFYSDYERNGAELLEKYKAEHGNVIDPDKVKELSIHFKNNPYLAAAVHEPSSMISKEMLMAALREKKANGDKSPTYFTAGGSGSGKGSTNAIAEQVFGLAKNGLVFDSVMGSVKSAMTKIQDALDTTEGDVCIGYTNANIETACLQNAHRKRTVSIETLVDAHAGAANTIRQLKDEYRNNPRVKIEVLDNRGKKEEAHLGSIEDVPRYDKEAEITRLKAAAKEWLRSGEISQEKFDKLVN